ncbi:MAG: DUF2442 domain-containing protein [Spirochaetes bacterium]|nr:DUF2442 domain-containing protein [Spirochaetota bacterium]
MYFNIMKAEHVSDFKIRLFFSNGKSGIVDLESYIADGEIFSGIRAPEEFNKYFVDFGTLAWKNGDIDIAPETLYEMATGEKIVFTQDQIHKAV